MKGPVLTIIISQLSVIIIFANFELKCVEAGSYQFLSLSYC
jgi:hypothetical protein